MKKILLASVLFLGGCGEKHIVVTPPAVPELPTNLSKKAENLSDITDLSMGGLVLDGVETDKKYNSIGHKLNTLIDVYNCVKTSLNDKKDPKSCVN